MVVKCGTFRLQPLPFQIEELMRQVKARSPSPQCGPVGSTNAVTVVIVELSWIINHKSRYKYISKYIYIYMYIYMYIYIYVHIYIYMYIYIHTYIWLHNCMYNCITLYDCDHSNSQWLLFGTPGETRLSYTSCWPPSRYRRLSFFQPGKDAWTVGSGRAKLPKHNMELKLHRGQGSGRLLSFLICAHTHTLSLYIWM